ncbi:ISKra4 family transposase, partial [Streptomyces sp. NPDC051555]
MSAYDVFDAAGEFSAARTLFDSMTLALSSPRAAETSHDALEDFLAETGRELQRLLYQAHLNLRAHTERRGTEVTDSSGTVHRRIESGHTRTLATVFGQVTTTRMAYRAPGRENLYPADAVLNLPAGLHSHSLRRLAADEAVRGSYDAALDALTSRCGKVIGKRAAEQLTIRAAGDIDSYYQRLCPPACPDETLLVISTDGKGIVMRPEALREETRKAAEAKKRHPASGRLAPGEKPHRKRMATLGAVYDALPRPRTPDDVITLPTDT